MQNPLSSVPSQPSAEPSSVTLDCDLAKFLDEGKGNLKKAKMFNNVIAPRFFNIPIDHVRLIFISIINK